MKQNPLLKLLAVIIVIVGVFAAFIAPLAGSIRQGLDLQGGTHVVLEGVDTEQAQVNDDAMNRVVKIMEKRVNELGLTEPIIQANAVLSLSFLVLKTQIKLLLYLVKQLCLNSKMKKAILF